MTNNISSFSLFRKKVVLITIQKKSNIQHNKWERIAFADSFSWFGDQGEGLRLEQGMMGVKGCLMERGRWGEHGGVQRGEGDWPGEDGGGRLAA